jgi:Rieske Fe-S protein
MTATVAAIVAPILVYIWPGKLRGVQKQWITVTLQGGVTPREVYEPQNRNKAFRFQAGEQQAFIYAASGGDLIKGGFGYAGYMVNADGKVFVLSNSCTHLGCPVAWNQAVLRFQCPCHGSQFNIYGQVVHGPAQAPLVPYYWKIDSQGNLLIAGVVGSQLP